MLIIGINGATSVAQTSGGGGTTSVMPWREKDEDYLHWAWRAMQYAKPSTILATKSERAKDISLARTCIYNNEWENQ